MLWIYFSKTLTLPKSNISNFLESDRAMMEEYALEAKGESWSEGEYVRVHFRVKCPTKLGQSLAITGSSISLGLELQPSSLLLSLRLMDRMTGNYNASKVINLYTTPEAYPVWYTDVESPVLIHKREIETVGIRYNYCLLEGGAVKAFEKIPLGSPALVGYFISFHTSKVKGLYIPTRYRLRRKMQTFACCIIQTKQPLTYSWRTNPCFTDSMAGSKTPTWTSPNRSVRCQVLKASCTCL